MALITGVQRSSDGNLPAIIASGILRYVLISKVLFESIKNCGLWTLSCDFAHTFNETLKWLTQLPTLMQNHSGGDSVTSRC